MDKECILVSGMIKLAIRYQVCGENCNHTHVVMTFSATDCPSAQYDSIWFLTETRMSFYVQIWSRK